MDANEVAAAIGKPHFVMRRRIWQERWDVVPPPGAALGKGWWWRRKDVEKRLAGRSSSA